MLQSFIKVLNQADEIIGHNSDKFDTKWIRTRCAYHRIAMMPDYKSIDTLKAFRGGFNMPTNRLDAIGRYFGVGKKIKTTEELWFDVWQKKSRKALSQMVRYCKQDVLLLENVFNIINPYVKPKTHLTGITRECPECGSDQLQINRHRVTVAGAKQVQFQCKDCGKYHTVSATKFYKNNG